MPTIERKPLPPPGSAAARITEGDRAEIMAHANDVLDYYLNGPGSYFAAGHRKPLISDEFGESTIADLKNFQNSVIASRQFADDPGDIMGAVARLIDKTIKQVESVAQNTEGKDDLRRPLPPIDDPIERPPAIYSRRQNNAPSYISLPAEQAGGMPPAIDNNAAFALDQSYTRDVRAETPPAPYGAPSHTDPDFRELSSPVLPLGWSRSPQFAPNRAQQQPGKLIGIVTGHPFDPLPPLVFGLPNRYGSSGNDIEDMFARLINSYDR